MTLSDEWEAERRIRKWQRNWHAAARPDDDVADSLVWAWQAREKAEHAARPDGERFLRTPTRAEIFARMYGSLGPPGAWDERTWSVWYDLEREASRPDNPKRNPLAEMVSQVRTAIDKLGVPNVSGHKHDMSSDWPFKTPNVADNSAQERAKTTTETLRRFEDGMVAEAQAPTSFTEGRKTAYEMNDTYIGEHPLYDQLGAHYRVLQVGGMRNVGRKVLGAFDDWNRACNYAYDQSIKYDLIVSVFYVDANKTRWNGARYDKGNLTDGSTGSAYDPKLNAERRSVLVPPTEFPLKVTHVIMVRSGKNGEVLAHMFFNNENIAMTQFDRLRADGVKNVVLYESADVNFAKKAIVDGILYTVGTNVDLVIDRTFSKRNYAGSYPRSA